MDDWGMYSKQYTSISKLKTDIDEPTSGTSTPAAPIVAPKPAARSKWQDEDKEDSEEVRLVVTYTTCLSVIYLVTSFLNQTSTYERHEKVEPMEYRETKCRERD
jgi:hypothetical protein